MIGTPVSLWARATARFMISSSGVTPSKSAAHFSTPALTSVPPETLLDVAHELTRIWLGETWRMNRGTSSHQPVTLMMLTPDAAETARREFRIAAQVEGRGIDHRVDTTGLGFLQTRHGALEAIGPSRSGSFCTSRWRSP